MLLLTIFGFDITTILILISVVMSLMAFNKHEYYNKWLFSPYYIHKFKEYYRWISSGFIHANLPHLLFNMLALYSFGIQLEYIYGQIFGNKSAFMFAILYIGGLIVSDIPTYLKNKYNNFYASLGASGAICSVMFAFILFKPFAMINFIIPGILFVILFIIISIYLERQGGGGINHSAHLYGGLWGLLFTIVSYPQSLNFFLNEVARVLGVGQ